MSQKQQIIPIDKHSQGFKDRNNNNRSSQNQGGGSKNETQRVNSYTGNTIRTQEQKRKTVFKAVLDSPFNINWPEVSIKDQNEILDALCETLLIMKKPSKKRNKKIKVLEVESNDDEFNKNDTSSNKLEDISSIRSNICFGINEVTKHLERMTSPHPLISAIPNYQSNSSKKYQLLEMVFVCKADLLPQLYSHFPTLCSIAGDVLLVPLPFGASKRISDAVNFKRVSCIGVKINAPEFTNIYKMVKEKVKFVSTPWLNPLKPPENLLNQRKILEEEFTHSLSSNNSFKRKQVEMTYDKPKIKVEVASSSHATSSPSTFLFGQQPQIKIEPTSTQLKQTGFDYVPTRIKQLITTAPINKDQAREKRREKKLKYRQKKMNIN
ncbi:hypothetical protein RclHR1_02470010 [Rhizophagus clarus]|uniref:Uncharacterized protein n=1 Tax=Rhizophagus clarus TaxID=94130 RepID=A0A2Z6RSH2_9GLOM|nr:hypothetical protein RclHR1_02470010 [Rhizophagus clarus]GES75498.1 hypothetical protein RCL_jg9030.t1 [Rhizophagus clarus]